MENKLNQMITKISNKIEIETGRKTYVLLVYKKEEKTSFLITKA